MSETVSIAREGPERARAALERCVGSGGVAIFPADTVYGFACDPLDVDAIRRVNGLKARPEGKPAAVMFFAPLAMLELIGSLGPQTRDALAKLLPGAVTLVIANPERHYPLACGTSHESLGVRLIEGPLSGARCPVLQTSANRAAAPAPRSLSGVDDELRRAVDLVIDGGGLPGTASTVVDLSDLDVGGGWRLLREGAVGGGEVARALAREPG